MAQLPVGRSNPARELHLCQGEACWAGLGFALHAAIPDVTPPRTEQGSA